MLKIKAASECRQQIAQKEWSVITQQVKQAVSKFKQDKRYDR